MTNPFAIIALHAFDSYQKSLGSNTYSQYILPKALLCTVGTTILATVIYKSFKYTTTNNEESSNFLSKFLRPLQFLFNQDNAPDQEQMQFEDKYFKEYDEWIRKQSESEPEPESEPESESKQDKDAINIIVSTEEQKHKKECLENMYYSEIREHINDFYGDVIMCYDHKIVSFVYYARTANIPYKYLETISRKYMIETNAPREIHVDIRNEYKKAKDRAAPKTAPKTESAPVIEPVQPTEKDVFVKLKSYNTASNLNLHTTTNDTNDKTRVANTTTKPTNKIIRERANRYSYRGKINDFEENHRRPAASVPAASESVSTSEVTNAEVKDYAEFKKQMMKTRSAL